MTQYNIQFGKNLNQTIVHTNNINEVKEIAEKEMSYRSESVTIIEVSNMKVKPILISEYVSKTPTNKDKYIYKNKFGGFYKQWRKI